MRVLISDLRAGASGLALVSVALSGPALAQSANPQVPNAPAAQSAPGSPQANTPQSALTPDPSEAAGIRSSADATDDSEIIVTGSSIRGVAPVGSNLISIGRDEIAKTAAPSITQLLQTVPALSNFGNAGRGGNGNGGVGASVYIHQIGASAQNSTLVLVDGHRLPPSGVTSSVVDPNNVPAIMLERVEVLAEGASSIYGSDAVAGVVNFITRKKFDGVEVRAQTTLIDGTSPGRLGAVIAGKTWETGNAIIAYQYSWEDELANTKRPQTSPLVQAARADAAGVTGTGNSNFGNFACNPAAIRPNAAGTTIFPSATAAAPISAAAASAICEQWRFGALLPKETRHNAMIKVSQELNDSLTLYVDGTYNKRRSTNRISRGTFTANAFGPGAGTGTGNGVVGQANPFYINPPGITSQRQEIRYDFNDLYGPGAYTANGDETIYGSVTLNYKAFGDWQFDLIGVAGRASSFFGENVGAVNTQLATLYLNGTTQAGGSTTAQSLPGGPPTITLNLPLTTANALDVWNPAGTNRTSGAVREALLNSRNLNRQINSLEQIRFVGNGSLFALPAGDLKIAVGAEFIQTGILQDVTRPLAIAGTSVASQFYRYKFDRNVFSGFVETLIPVISEDMEIPLIRKFDVSLAVRHDEYNDFGGTTNPKASFNWDPFEGLRIRGNASRSFVAPGLNINGRPFGNANFSGVSTVTNNTNIPLANYPVLAAAVRAGTGFQGLLSGCSPTAATCNIAQLQGIQGNVGDPENGPQKGKGWSIGADFTPTNFLSGLRVSATLWDVTFLGGITNPAFNITVNTGSIANRVLFYPNCATPADVAATVGTQPQLANYPACISYIGIGNNGNYLSFFTRGLDLSASYRLPTDIGAFTVGADLTQLLRFNQGFAARGEKPVPDQTFSVKNTVGLNTTFPNVATQLRGHIGWTDDSLSADIYANYTGDYKNVSGTARNPIELTPAGVYSGRGGDQVKSQTTFDLTLGYRFSPGFVGDSTLQVRVRNLFDKNPPYFNNAQGFDPFVANVLGRTVAISLSTKL